MASYSIPRLSDREYKSIIEQAKRMRFRKLQNARNAGKVLSEDDELSIPVEDKADFNCAMPTEDEIKQRKLEVQARWSEIERRKRAGCLVFDRALDIEEMSEQIIFSSVLRRRSYVRLHD